MSGDVGGNKVTKPDRIASALSGASREWVVGGDVRLLRVALLDLLHLLEQ